MDYCFDIDGTICSNTNGEYQKAIPRQFMIDKVNQLYDSGHGISFFTARGSTSGIDWNEFTEAQLKGWGVKFHKLILGKPHADIYIDDKSIHPVDWIENRDMPQEVILDRQDND